MAMAIEGMGLEESVSESLEHMRVNLASRRHALGMSQQRVGAWADVSAKTLASMESGASEGYPSTLAKLARVLNVFVGDLFLPPAEFEALYAGIGTMTVSVTADGGRPSTTRRKPASGTTKGAKRTLPTATHLALVSAGTPGAQG